MIQTIRVGETFEMNNCAGRKVIHVTDGDFGGMVPPRFELTRNYMFPLHKLTLSTVEPGDMVSVQLYDAAISGLSLVCGCFDSNLTNMENRHHICKCGNPLVSDGFGVFCFNQHCHLTVLTRIMRLANTPFFPNISAMSVEDRLELDSVDGCFTSTPFAVLNSQDLYENGNVLGIEGSLLYQKNKTISVATFLVEDLFIDYIESIPNSQNLNPSMFLAVRSFYGHMLEICNRRNTSSRIQNGIIANFMWSLGIESLNRDVICKMIDFEISMEVTSDVFMPYVYFLTNPTMMMKELGICETEAKTIYSEIVVRRYELSDIFSKYATKEDVHKLFGRIRI